MDKSEKRFESDIEAFLISEEGGYTKPTERYDAEAGLYVETLINFIKATQPREWERFEKQCAFDSIKKFCLALDNAIDMDGLVSVLRHGFKHRGIKFRVCYFKPESHLNKTAQYDYEQNVCYCQRQWYYSTEHKKSVDMVLSVNGIPIVALELKNQYTGQTISNAKEQWMYDRDPRELPFRFNKRILAYYCVDHVEALMATKLDKGNTYFLPFNQGSNGAGNNGGAGNPPNPNGYPTSYLWEEVLQKDSLLNILQKFIHHEEKKKRIIFPRYHQLDVVRKLIADVRENGAGKNYLIQHSAGSGKSNSIAWTAYRLASLHDEMNRAIFASVIIVTDRTVLDAQLQETVSSFDHTLGTVETIGEGKKSTDLRDAINNGVRIIVTTLQKFPVIYTEVDKADGRNFAVIVDEAHSSQTGSSAMKLKTALADTEEALREYAEIEGKAEDEIDAEDAIVKELIAQGKHKNLSFFAFTATPKGQTLEMFGTPYEDGSFHPFHTYSMKQAIEEGFIMDVLQNYMTYATCFKIAKTIKDNPDVPSSRASKVIKRFEELHPYNISQKTQIIVETFLTTTKQAIGGKGKMMVVTSSRLAAVRYYHEVKRYIEEKGYDNVEVLVAFSGSIKDGDEEYTESKLNTRKDGSRISEEQLKEEFHNNFNVLIVAEKYQTGFDEPLLHTMIVDKKLRGVKCVQTLSRLNRICEGKTDTFILDFVNTAEEVQEAFQPFYQETILTEEINTELIYKVVKEIREYRLYTDSDIQSFIALYRKESGAKNAMGKMTSILKTTADKYNLLSTDERYQYRRALRCFTKWYGYVSQVARIFDKELHEEYLFCSYLLHLLPPNSTEPLDLEGKLKLEYYKLQKTYEGQIKLADENGEYTPKKGGGGTPDKKEPLDEVIDKINLLFAGNFTDADRVILYAMHEILKGDPKLRRTARSSNPQIFTESIFPKVFEKIAQEAYVEQTEAYTALFQDQSKYNAIMVALAEILYREFNKKD